MLELIDIKTKNKMGLLLEMTEVGGIDFEIPEAFLRVITKMLPEIETVEISSVDTYSTISAMTLETIQNFLVRLNVILKEGGGNPRGGIPTYGEEIRKLFRLTYPEHNFITFEVMVLHVKPNLSNMEKFVELFGVKKEGE